VPTNTKLAIYIAVVVGAASTAVAKDQDARRNQAGAASLGGRIEPYGTDAEVQQCVMKMEASLNGRSILGSRDTAAYIQDRGNLDDMGLTEYDVMVGRCRNNFFHRYIRLRGGQPR
jgi:hypothetical protein